MKLYHFTCEHGAESIHATGELRTNLHPVLAEHLLWLTPSSSPKGADLGMPHRRRGSILECDRMANRFEVETDSAVPWSSVRDRWTPPEVAMLEQSRGAKPDQWWVAFTSIPLAEAGTEEGDGHGR